VISIQFDITTNFSSAQNLEATRDQLIHTQPSMQAS